MLSLTEGRRGSGIFRDGGLPKMGGSGKIQGL